MRKQYRYGMRLRPFDIGCQPKKGLIGCVEWMNPEEASKYHDVILYDRKLTDEEVEHYSLVLIREVELIDPDCKEIPEESLVMDM